MHAPRVRTLRRCTPDSKWSFIPYILYCSCYATGDNFLAFKQFPVMSRRARAQLWAYIIICYRKWGEKYASITPLFRGPSAISAARRRRNKSWRRAGKTPQRWRWWPRNRKKNGAQTITQLWKNINVNIFCVNYTFAINTARLRLRFTYTVGSKLCFFWCEDGFKPFSISFFCLSGFPRTRIF